MAKARKAAKRQKKAAQDAKKITPAKLFRIFLKVFAISIVCALLIGLVDAFTGWELGNKLWARMALMFAIVIIAQPFIMSELRPKK